jgi:YD repeat-containing protein
MSHGLQLTGGTVTRLVYDGNDTVGAITAQQDLTGATITTTVTNTNP